MKKVCLIAAALALLVLLVGCNDVERALDHAEDRVENMVDRIEDTVEEAVAPRSTPEAALSREQAESIALEYVQLEAGTVSRLRTEYEVDDGVPQYDVQFYDGAWEYEFEIHAETGQILSFDKDTDR